LIKLVFLEYFSNFVLVNHGLVFGLGSKAPTWVIFIILALILVWVLRAGPQYILGLALIFGGGLSNFLDRLWRGGVVDFKMLWLTAFNLADLAIVIGVLILLYRLFGKEKT